MADEPLRRAYNEIVETLDAFVQDTFYTLADAVFPTITGLTIILIAWQGYRVFYGRTGGESVSNSIVILVKYGVIMAIFGTFGLYELFIGNLFEDLPDAIASNMASTWSSASDSTDIIDLLDIYTQTATEKAMAHYRGYSIVEALEGMVIILVTYLYTLFAAFQFGLTIIVTKLFLALTPIALTAIMFDKTKGIFEGWLRTLTTMAALKILLILMVSMMMAIFGEAADALNPKDSTTGASSLAIFVLVTVLMLLITIRLPDFASQLGGGLSVSATNLTAAAVAGGIAMAAGAISRGDRFQRGARQGMAAAKAEGLDGKGQARAAVMRGATEAARPGLTGRRFEDARMKRRAENYVGELKRSEGSGGGRSEAGPSRSSLTPNQRRAAQFTNDVKRSEATD